MPTLKKRASRIPVVSNLAERDTVYPTATVKEGQCVYDKDLDGVVMFGGGDNIRDWQAIPQARPTSETASYETSTMVQVTDAASTAKVASRFGMGQTPDQATTSNPALTLPDTLPAGVTWEDFFVEFTPYVLGQPGAIGWAKLRDGRPFTWIGPPAAGTGLGVNKQLHAADFASPSTVRAAIAANGLLGDYNLFLQWVRAGVPGHVPLANIVPLAAFKSAQFAAQKTSVVDRAWNLGGVQTKSGSGEREPVARFVGNPNGNRNHEWSILLGDATSATRLPTSSFVWASTGYPPQDTVFDRTIYLGSVEAAALNKSFVASVIIGQENYTAGTTDSVQIGHGIHTPKLVSSVVISEGITVNGELHESVLIGKNAATIPNTASGEVFSTRQTVLGSHARARGFMATAIGSGAYADEPRTLALGSIASNVHEIEKQGTILLLPSVIHLENDQGRTLSITGTSSNSTNPNGIRAARMGSLLVQQLLPDGRHRGGSSGPASSQIWFKRNGSNPDPMSTVPADANTDQGWERIYTLEQIQTVVAGAADFTAFKAAMAAL